MVSVHSEGYGGWAGVRRRDEGRQLESGHGGSQPGAHTCQSDVETFHGIGFLLALHAEKVEEYQPRKKRVQYMAHEDRVVAASAEQSDVERVKSVLREYGVPFGVAAVIVLGLSWGWSGYRSHARRVVEEAAVKLTEARTAQELESIVADYPKTPSAPLALLRLAKLNYSLGAYEAAAAKYAEFGQKYQDHELVAGAQLGRIQCLEAQGHVQEALEGFERFIKTHQGHFLVPQAQLAQARCLEALGRIEEAKVIYSTMAAERAGSGWAKRAEEMLKTIEERMRWRTSRAKAATAIPSSTGLELFSVTNAAPLPSVFERDFLGADTNGARPKE
ncbi:MAG: YfgM family protein [Kiritimatiellia bacterium]